VNQTLRHGLIREPQQTVRFVYPNPSPKPLLYGLKTSATKDKIQTGAATQAQNTLCVNERRLTRLATQGVQDIPCFLQQIHGTNKKQKTIARRRTL
jgi:hypothetical protein